MNLDEFISEAGGIYTSGKDYDDFNGQDKYENFWSFFLDNDHGWVTSVYANIPIEDLYRNGHSIEHVIPKSVLKNRLRSQNRPRNVVNGSTTNPLNFMAAYNRLNSLRSSFEFDTEGDEIRRSVNRVPLNPNMALQTGLDHENEWVIPSRTQGDIARCVLYMMVVYGLDGLYEEDIDQMRRWALIDPPREWEVAFNNWVYSRLEIRNPLITNDLETLRNILASQDLFESTLASIPELPQRPPATIQGGLENGYAVLVGAVERIFRDTDDSPHMLFRIQANGNSWRGSINVQSNFDVSVDPTPGVPGNNLLVFIDDDWEHPLTDILEARDYQPGIHFVERSMNSGALDYIRGNLFDPTKMTTLPADKPGPSNDLFEHLEAILLEARDRGATVYAFGEPFENGRGIHNIHMNQGSVIQRFQATDGVWQDGGLIVRFAERWVAVFTAFQSQCWHTDDLTGRANEQNRCSRFSEGLPGRPGVSAGGLVRIVSALVNPAGQDTGNEQVTIINLGNEAVDLTGWKIVDRLDRADSLSGTLQSGSSIVITLSGNGALLGNSGGTITILDGENLRVHGVSYTSRQARLQGIPVQFIS